MENTEVPFGLDAFKKGWYTETTCIEWGIVVSVLTEEILHHEKSKYQDICIFDCKAFGRTLVLDNVVQCTEKYEFVYQEMLSFLPLNSHPNPKKVLIIGGGDGGIVREVTKHPSVESITLCDIDKCVTDVSKKYLPFLAKGFDSPKLTIHVGDGAAYMKQHKSEFDVIITDASDYQGLAACLYEKPYFESLKEALKPGGIIAAEGEGYWTDMDVIKGFLTTAESLFPVVDYATSHMAEYPGGHLGYILCSTSSKTNFRDPVHKFSPEAVKDFGLRYYTPEMHRASFALPLFVAEGLGLKWELS